MVTEMTYYRAHCDRAADLPALSDLRDRCAQIVAEELGPAVAGLALDAFRAAMLEALRFPPSPEVPVSWPSSRRGVQLVSSRTGTSPCTRS